ncbi:MAG TPA: molybdate ABC transporter substrate-binding protein [Polyangiales bacterium]|jgi:molybdate transport system substrate-binding protein
MLRNRTRHLALCLFALIALGASSAAADEVHVAVAANFLGTLQKLAEPFRTATGHLLVISPGATGQLYAQIAHGAPFDVLLSADSAHAIKLEEAGLGVRGTRFTYALGKLVLWSPKAGVVQAGGKLLLNPALHFVAIADPATAPYGSAAEKTLTALGWLPQLKAAGKIAIGESVGQAHQFAASGNADCAFVALSQILGPDGKPTGSSWIVPTSLSGLIDQDAILVSASSHKDAANAFLVWLHKDSKALAAIRAAGYGLPN